MAKEALQPKRFERLIESDFSLEKALVKRLYKESKMDYPGYPGINDRLKMDEADFEKWVSRGMPHEEIVKRTSSLVFDHTNNLRGRAKGAILYSANSDVTTVAYPESYNPGGYLRDSAGWPIHPLAKFLLQIGAVVGPGWYYGFGPQFTADTIVEKIRVVGNEKFLQFLSLIRTDTGRVALPGGMVDKDEPMVSAALRELLEEANLDVSELEKEVIHQGPVADQRATLNSWPETTLVRIKANNKLVKAKLRPQKDEVLKVKYLDASAQNIDSLFASHGDFVRWGVFKFQEETGLMVDKNGRILG